MTPLLLSLVLTATAMQSEPGRIQVLPGAMTGDVLPCRAALSADGRTVAFTSSAPLSAQDDNGADDVYLYERDAKRLLLVSRRPDGRVGRGPSRCPDLSADGHIVVFESDAPDLDHGDTQGTRNVFVFRGGSGAGTVSRISRFPSQSATNAGYPRISANGEVVVFHARDHDSPATEGYSVYRVNLSIGQVDVVARGHSPAISGDGRAIAYVGPSSVGGPAQIHVITAGTTRVVSGAESTAPDGASYGVVVSVDGEWIAYVSRATNLTAGARRSGRPQVYVERTNGHDRRLVSGAGDGTEGNGRSGAPAIDGDGTSVVFESTATNLGCGREAAASCAPDINLVADVFAWTRLSGTRRIIGAGLWLERSGAPIISADARVIMFYSRHPACAEDGRDTDDVFIVER